MLRVCCFCRHPYLNFSHKDIRPSGITEYLFVSVYGTFPLQRMKPLVPCIDIAGLQVRKKKQKFMLSFIQTIMIHCIYSLLVIKCCTLSALVSHHTSNISKMQLTILEAHISVACPVGALRAWGLKPLQIPQSCLNQPILVISWILQSLSPSPTPHPHTL